MSVAFYRGQQLGREDLNIFMENAAGTPSAAADITYALYDFTTGQEVLLGNPRRTPTNPSLGEYYASVIIPRDANLGDYRCRWTFREYVGATIQEVVQEFCVMDAVVASPVGGPAMSAAEIDLARKLRMALRDHNPDKHYRFSPPSHESTVSQHNRVFGHVWEDEELHEYLLWSLDMIAASPPRTPFSSIQMMVQARPEWRTLLMTGAKMHALDALRYNWIHEEFGYSIGGVSLDLEKSSKYEAAYQAAADQWDKQLEKAKQTVNFIAGLQQPRYGAGIRSSFGPNLANGVLAPGKFRSF